MFKINIVKIIIDIITKYIQSFNFILGFDFLGVAILILVLFIIFDFNYTANLQYIIS